MSYEHKIQAYFLGMLGRSATQEELTRYDAALVINNGNVWRAGLVADLTSLANWPTDAGALVTQAFSWLTGMSPSLTLYNYYVGKLIDNQIKPKGLVNAMLNDLSLMPKVDGSYGQPASWSVNLTADAGMLLMLQDKINTAQSLLAQATVNAAQVNSVQFSGVEGAALLANSSKTVMSLTSAYVWQDLSLTYGFNDQIPSDYYSVSASASLYGNLTTGWKTPTPLVKTQVTDIMQMINALSKLQLSYSENNADIRFNMLPTNQSAAAFAYYPGTGLGGDVFIDSAIDVNSLVKGDYGYFTLIHELGHALGLKHPFEDGVVLDQSNDNLVNSVMSYTDWRNDTPLFTASGNRLYFEAKAVYPETFMVYDVAALQAFYGVNLTANAQDDTYTMATTPFYTTIWDAGGTDTIDLSATENANTIRLTSGEYSDINVQTIEAQIAYWQASYRAQGVNGDSFVEETMHKYSTDIYTGESALGIAHGVVIENAWGGRADDVFYDNLVDNHLMGNDGNDRFYLGAGGFDRIEGGSGVDWAVLNAHQEQVTIESRANETYLIWNDYSAVLVGVEWLQLNNETVSLA